MFEFNDTRFTHMPFAAPGMDGEPEQFCCIQNEGLWKLYHFTGKKWKRVKTGLPADATECGPCAEFADALQTYLTSVERVDWNKLAVEAF